jgi:hypothetical protein
MNDAIPEDAQLPQPAKYTTSMRYRFLFLPLLLTSLASAAPPEVSSFLPTGVTRSQTAEVTAAGNLGGTWPAQIWSDNPGLTVEALADRGKLKVTAAADARPGLTWVRLMGADGASVPRPLFIGSLAEVAEVEPNNSIKERQQLSTPAVISGKLQKQNDVDFFSIPAQAGQTIVASAIANELLGSPMDAVLQICTENGTVLAQDHDSHGLDPQVTFTATQAGRYLVRIFAFPSEPNSTIAFAGGDNYLYRLTITTGGYADHVLPLAVQRGKPAELKLHGWNLPSPAATLDVPATDLRELLFFQPTDAAGLVPLAVTNYPSVVAELNASRETPQECPLPCVLSGRLDEPKDSDVFRFTAVKGKAISIKAESDSIGYEVDPVLRVMDDAGKILAEAESPRRGGEPVLSFTPPADGPYRLEISDLHRRGGLRYAYRLTLAPVTPDFTVTLAAGTFGIVPGKTLEIPLTIDRKNGFAGEIEITPENLPAGMTAAPLKSLPTGDTAKTVKLVLTAVADAKPGMIQLLAKSGGDVPLTHRATYSAKQGPSTFNHGDVWLSIGK